MNDNHRLDMNMASRQHDGTLSDAASFSQSNQTQPRKFGNIYP